MLASGVGEDSLDFYRHCVPYPSESIKLAVEDDGVDEPRRVVDGRLGSGVVLCA